jgi:hypothetical protein
MSKRAGGKRRKTPGPNFDLHTRILPTRTGAVLTRKKERRRSSGARLGSVGRGWSGPATRHRPHAYFFGGVRGGEALDMLQSMNTGHDGSLSTALANTRLRPSCAGADPPPATDGFLTGTNSTERRVQKPDTGRWPYSSRRLIEGPDGVCICNECFDLCVEILEERRTVQQRVRRHPTLSVM